MSGPTIFSFARIMRRSPAPTGLTALRRQPWRSIELRNLTILRRSVKSGYVWRSGWFFGVTLPVRQGYLPLCSGLPLNIERRKRIATPDCSSTISSISELASSRTPGYAVASVPTSLQPFPRSYEGAPTFVSPRVDRGDISFASRKLWLNTSS
jgi:hypothetical protein